MDKKRNPHDLLVENVVMLGSVMLSKGLAMVPHDHKDGLIV